MSASSDQMPNEAMLATSCLVSSICWSGVRPSHSGVSYSEPASGGP